jgi:hypothetical protein
MERDAMGLVQALRNLRDYRNDGLASVLTGLALVLPLALAEPKFPLAGLLIGGSCALGLWAYRRMVATSAPPSPSWLADSAGLYAPVWLRASVLVLCAEVSLVLVFWTDPPLPGAAYLGRLQRAVADGLLPLLPSLQRIPVDLADLAIGDRIDALMRAFGIGYAVTLVVQLDLLQATSRLVIAAWRQPDLGRSKPREENVGARLRMIAGLVMAPIAVHAVYRTTGIGPYRPHGGRGIGVPFQDFESSDIELVYRAVPVQTLGALVIAFGLLAWGLLVLSVMRGLRGRSQAAAEQAGLQARGRHE